MQTKPFSVQSPEDIAKQYGGNKQKIAQAMQSGIVDPTAGLLAGMFIDRMRSAQAQEMGQQPTVAQQVMAPPSQPAAPLGSPAAGLGAIAPGGAPAAPAAPAAPPAPMGMASGGLASLPVPDDMFDAGDEYAAGGIVAFADGGGVGPALVEAVMSLPEFALLLSAKERGIGGEQVKELENQLLGKLHARGYEMQDLRSAVDEAIETVYAVPRANQLQQAALEQYSTPTEGLRPDFPPVRVEDRTPRGLESVFATPRAEQLRMAGMEQYGTPAEGLRPDFPPVRVEDRTPRGLESVFATPRAEQLRQAALEQYGTPAEGLRPDFPPVRVEDRTPRGLESVYATQSLRPEQYGDIVTPELMRELAARAAKIAGGEQPRPTFAPVPVIDRTKNLTQAELQRLGARAAEIDAGTKADRRSTPREEPTPEVPPGAIDFGIIGNKSQLGLRKPKPPHVNPPRRASVEDTEEMRQAMLQQMMQPMDTGRLPDSSAEAFFGRREGEAAPSPRRVSAAETEAIRQAALQQMLTPTSTPTLPTDSSAEMFFGRRGEERAPPPADVGRGRGMRTPSAAPAAPTAPAAAEQAPTAAKSDEMQSYLDAMGPRPELSYLKGIDLDKQRKQDMWAALAQLGFGMAASKSPSFLGALGESATAALPGMQKSQAERRAMEREMAKAQYDEQMAARAERGEARKFQIGREDVAAQRKLEEDKLKQAMDIAKMGQATQLAVARVYAGMQSGRPLARPDILEVAQAIAEDNGRSRATEADMEKAAKMLGRGGSDKSAGATAIAALTGAKDDPLGLFKD